jgi:5-formyltetrahydrofolate cyclo-ligase
MLAAEVKSILRRQMLLKRKTISLETVTAGSLSICRQLLSWPVFQQAKTVMGYLAMPGEPHLDNLLIYAIKAGKTVCVPLLSSVYGVMESAAITDFNELIAGRLGVRMPDPSRARILDPSLIDLILTPGVAFDEGGSRLGMGAGYYDRFLTRAPQALRAGISWSGQLVSEVPRAKHDILMQWVVTEDRIINCDTSFVWNQQ